MRCYEGNILTVNKDDDVYRYLVEDQGKILYVGDQLPDKYKGIKKVHLGKRALVPSFVDTHQHFASYATFHAGLNVMEARSNREIAEMIRNFVSNSSKKTLIAFGTHAPCTEPDPILWMDKSVNNPNKKEAISIQEALRCCTINGYGACFDEEERGSLEVGKIADMVVLSENPYEVEKERIHEVTCSHHLSIRLEVGEFLLCYVKSGENDIDGKTISKL